MTEEMRVHIGNIVTEIPLYFWRRHRYIDLVWCTRSEPPPWGTSARRIRLDTVRMVFASGRLRNGRYEYPIGPRRVGLPWPLLPADVRTLNWPGTHCTFARAGARARAELRLVELIVL